MADGAADLIDTDISRPNGKFSSRNTLWRSSRFKYRNMKRIITEIEIGQGYCFDVNASCQPAPLTVAGKVPDMTSNVVLKISRCMIEGG